jgi:hypothetical protein
VYHFHNIIFPVGGVVEASLKFQNFAALNIVTQLLEDSRIASFQGHRFPGYCTFLNVSPGLGIVTCSTCPMVAVMLSECQLAEQFL